MRTMDMVREYLYDDIQEVMRAPFEEIATFQDAKKEYDFYYYLFNNTWDCSRIKYKYFLAEELKKEDNEQWKKSFLRRLYEFYCPEEFSEPKPDIEDAGFDANYEVAPAPPSWFGDLHPVEEAPIRFRIGE